MGEQATYTLKVDWNNDGDFADAGENISADWIKARIRRGFSGPLARMAMVGRASFQLKNSAQAYSPPAVAIVLPACPVIFQMTYNATTETLFRGFVEAIRAHMGDRIRQVLQLYERAQDTLDVDLFARIYPALVGEKRQTLERAWQGLAKQQVELEIRQIEVKSSHAVVRAFQRLSATPRIGTEQRDARERTFDLDKRGDTWVIVRLE